MSEKRVEMVETVSAEGERRFEPTSPPTLRHLAEAATPGPWQVVERRYIDDGSGKGICGKVAERRIFTTWDHPQMKGPIGVVNGAVTIWPVEGSDAKATHLVSIDEADAAYIAAANPQAVLALLDQLEQAVTAEDNIDGKVRGLEAALVTAQEERDQWKSLRDDIKSGAGRAIDDLNDICDSLRAERDAHAQQIATLQQQLAIALGPDPDAPDEPLSPEARAELEADHATWLAEQQRKAAAEARATIAERERENLQRQSDALLERIADLNTENYGLREDRDRLQRELDAAIAKVRELLLRENRLSEALDDALARTRL